MGKRERQVARKTRQETRRVIGRYIDPAIQSERRKRINLMWWLIPALVVEFVGLGLFVLEVL